MGDEEAGWVPPVVPGCPQCVYTRVVRENLQRQLRDARRRELGALIVAVGLVFVAVVQAMHLYRLGGT